MLNLSFSSLTLKPHEKGSSDTPPLSNGSKSIMPLQSCSQLIRKTYIRAPKKCQSHNYIPIILYQTTTRFVIFYSFGFNFLDQLKHWWMRGNCTRFIIVYYFGFNFLDQLINWWMRCNCTFVLPQGVLGIGWWPRAERTLGCFSCFSYHFLKLSITSFSTPFVYTYIFVTFFKIFNFSFSYFLLHRFCAGILEQSMGARNQVGIGLSYRPSRARICNCIRSPGIDSVSLRSVAGR